VSLFWRVFLANTAILLVAVLLLLYTPFTLSATPTTSQALVILLGFVGVLTANVIAMRRAFRPLEQVVERMARVDALGPAEHMPISGSPEVATVVRTFNAMTKRLEIERRTSGALALGAQEAERTRIALSLHDSVGQSLTAVLLHLKRAADLAPESLRVELEYAQEAARESLDEVRRVATELRPPELDALGLVPALAALANKMERSSGLVIEQRFPDELPPLDPDVELAVYRVAQECLTNTARHADASRSEILLEAAPDSLVLRVTDDGRGMQSGNGDGLRGMRERALYAHGSLAVDQSERGGVEVLLVVPTAVAGNA